MSDLTVPPSICFGSVHLVSAFCFIPISSSLITARLVQSGCSLPTYLYSTFSLNGFLHLCRSQAEISQLIQLIPIYGDFSIGPCPSIFTCCLCNYKQKSKR